VSVGLKTDASDIELKRVKFPVFYSTVVGSIERVVYLLTAASFKVDK